MTNVSDNLEPGPGQAQRLRQAVRSTRGRRAAGARTFVFAPAPPRGRARRPRDRWLHHQLLAGAVRDAASREAEVLHAGLSRARDAELVAHPDREDRYRVLLGGYLPHGVGQPADYAVLLGGHPDPRLAE